MPDKQPQPREEFPSYQPTPTQIENDLAAVGYATIHKAPDGSGTLPIDRPPDTPPTEPEPKRANVDNKERQP